MGNAAATAPARHSEGRQAGRSPVRVSHWVRGAIRTNRRVPGCVRGPRKGTYSPTRSYGFRSGRMNRLYSPLPRIGALRAQFRQRVDMTRRCPRQAGVAAQYPGPSRENIARLLYVHDRRRVFLSSRPPGCMRMSAPMSSHPIEQRPIHMALGATAAVEPEFIGSMDRYGAFVECHRPDGAEGRLVSQFSSDKPWAMREIHPAACEVTLYSAGRITLHQEHADGTHGGVSIGPRKIRDQRTRHVAHCGCSKQRNRSIHPCRFCHAASAACGGRHRRLPSYRCVPATFTSRRRRPVGGAGR